MISYPSTPDFQSLQGLIFVTMAMCRPLEPRAMVAFTKECFTNQIQFSFKELIKTNMTMPTINYFLFNGNNDSKNKTLAIVIE